MSRRKIEVRARITNYDKFCKISERLNKGPPQIISLSVKFYRVSNGWLKMTKYSNNIATLVSYERENGKGPRIADYELIEFTDKEQKTAKLLDEMLNRCLGIQGRVFIERKLYVVGTSCVIHIDTVQGLGHFVEIEVDLAPGESVGHGTSSAEDIQYMLGVQDEDLLECTYVDLLNGLHNVQS